MLKGFFCLLMFSQILQHPLKVLITYLNVCRSHVSIWNKALEKGVGLVRPQTNKLLPLNNRFQFMTRTTIKLLLYVLHIRRLVGSTDHACSSGLYFRISWKSTERPFFFKIIPSHFCRASEASKIDCFKN